MIPVSLFADRRVVILGLGRTGLSAARALGAGGTIVLGWDDDPAKREIAKEEGILLLDLQFCDWGTITALILSPGIPHTFPTPHPIVKQAKAAGVEVISDLEVFARTQPHAYLIGVTGTNGKSTTAALIAHILQQAGYKVQIGGNIGTGVLTLDPLPPQGCYVLEMSSYQLELTPSICFDGAVLLNIVPDHIARHGSFQGYIAAKERIFRHQGKDQVAVIGIDEPETEAIYQHLLAEGKQTVIGLSASRPVKSGIYVEGHTLIDDFTGPVLPVLDLRETSFLQGLQNRQNIAAAYGICRHKGLAPEVIIKGLKSFKSLGHRQEIIAVIDEVTYINDSKATNAASVAYALNNYENIFWIVGGRPKSDGITSLLPYLPKVRHAFIIGEALEAFSKVLGEHIPLTQSGTLEQAVRDAYKLAHACQNPYPVVLLSPACESFDQFKDYVHRGECFKQCIDALPGPRGSVDHPPFLKTGH